ncbi:MAG: SDR family oxidoreductase [Verrucomicrobiota bacterium]
MKQSHQTILVAGSTGYLGRHIVRQLLKTGHSFHAIARNANLLLSMGANPESIDLRQVTEPESLVGSCEAIDTVISTVGITRQKDGLTYMDVDYQANRNLLDEAIRAGVRKFIYISALHGEKLRHLKIFEAKEKFVDELRASGLEYTIVRPNGFFSDMADFSKMAERGRVVLFGDGSQKLNPIHGADLAEAIVEAINGTKTTPEIGGPDVLSHEEIATLAMKAHGKKPKIFHLPDWIRRFVIAQARRFTPVKVYGPLEFFLTTMQSDYIAPRYGTEHLGDFFASRAQLNAGASPT